MRLCVAMKTTVEIADDLLQRVQRLARGADNLPRARRARAEARFDGTAKQTEKASAARDGAWPRLER